MFSTPIERTSLRSPTRQGGASSDQTGDDGTGLFWMTKLPGTIPRFADDISRGALAPVFRVLRITANAVRLIPGQSLAGPALWSRTVCVLTLSAALLGVISGTASAWQGAGTSGVISIPTSYTPTTLNDAKALLKKRRLADARKVLLLVREAGQSGQAPAFDYISALQELIRVSSELDQGHDALLFCREFIQTQQGKRNVEADIVNMVVMTADTLNGANFASDALQLLEDNFDIGISDAVELQTQIGYRLLLAQAATVAGDQAEAVDLWVTCTKHCQQALVERLGQPASERTFYVYRYSQCLFAIGKQREALTMLFNHLVEQSKAQDQAGRRETMKFIADMYQQMQNHPKSSEQLVMAISLQKQHFERDEINLARLYSELIEEGSEHGVRPDQTDEARGLFVGLVKRAREDEDLELLEFCLKNLRNIYSYGAKYPSAIEAAEELAQLRTDTLGLTHRKTNDARAELAHLYGKIGRVQEAVSIMQGVVDYWEQRQPQLPLETAKALNDLGNLLKNVGRFAEAQSIFEKCLEIRLANLPPQHESLVTSYSNVASIYLARAIYRKAVDAYEKAITICETHGEKLHKKMASMQLDLAVAYRDQGQLDKAEHIIEDSMRIQKKLYGDHSFGLVGHYNALARLHRAQVTRLLAGNPDDKQVEEAIAHIDKGVYYAVSIELLCREHGTITHPIMGEAWHHQASLAKRQGLPVAARRYWEQALEVQKLHNDKPAIARSLNELAMLAAADGDLVRADELLTRSLASWEELKSFPRETYSALVNLAVVSYKRGRPQDASKYLARAIQITESPRAAASGAEGERAKYLAQFSKAFETLIDWRLQEYIDGGELQEELFAEAFLTAERSRNRTFLDLLSFAGVDLRATLKGPEGDALRRQEADMRLKIKRIRTRALQTRDPLESDNLKVEFANAQGEYAVIWKRIREKSPVYDEMLSNGGKMRTLQDVRDAVLDDETIMLMYILGTQKSWLLVIGSQPGDAFVFPLEVSVQDVGPGGALGFSGDLGHGTRSISSEELPEPIMIRGFVADEPEPEPTIQLGPPGPLTREKVRRLVANVILGLKAKLTNPDPFRELKKPDITFGNVIIPQEARELIAEFEPTRIIVVPDGALHTIPFEGVVVRSGDEPEFVLDALPPIAYAPSANVLASLAERTQQAPPKLLSVGNPAYPQWGDEKTRKKDEESENTEKARGAYLDIGGSIPLLPGTGREVKAVCEMFGPSATQFVWEEATEKNLTAEIDGVRFLHVAAHGLVDETHENLFGSLALTPGDTGDSENDGFLSYNEILRLPLKGCQLAALSACETNVGPERPNEAGSTLAQAFLAAGARRVIASQWCVSDDSTAILMSLMFNQVHESTVDGDRLEFSDALQNARKSVRENPKFKAPYYWAPFILLGPGR